MKTVRVGPFDTGPSEGGASTGHVVGGTGWYRKHFTLTPAEQGKRVAVRFDGVYMNADFWINGQPLGNHPYGYTSFEFDLTPYLKPAGRKTCSPCAFATKAKTAAGIPARASIATPG